MLTGNVSFIPRDKYKPKLLKRRYPTGHFREINTITPFVCPSKCYIRILFVFSSMRYGTIRSPMKRIWSGYNACAKFSRDKQAVLWYFPNSLWVHESMSMSHSFFSSAVHLHKLFQYSQMVVSGLKSIHKILEVGNLWYFQIHDTWPQK